MYEGACTFMVKVKAHRGEPLNEKADTQAESTRQLPSEYRQWTTHTQKMTYEWRDNDGVTHVTAWSKASGAPCLEVALNIRGREL